MFESIFFRKEQNSIALTEKATPGGEPWTLGRDAQMDICFISDRWNNIVTNVETTPDMDADSDHYGVCVEIRIKAKSKARTCHEHIIRFTAPIDDKTTQNMK